MRGLLRRRAKGSFRDMTLLRAVGLAVVVAAAGCASAPVAGEPMDGTYVGAVQGSDAWITVVVRGNDAAVYACGGAASFSTVSRWYVGTRAGQAVTVSKDGWTATATVSGGYAVGKLTPPTGAPLAFDVGRAHADTLTDSTRSPIRASAPASSFARIRAAVPRCKARGLVPRSTRSPR